MDNIKLQTREGIFEAICKAARSNTLGLFVGSGLPKAVLKNNRTHKAYSWMELLQKACAEMGITKNLFNDGRSYPQIASAICQDYVQIRKVNLKDAERKLKITIARLVDASLSSNVLTEYEEYFKELVPNWIVTTNYDTIIEQILREKAFIINPKDSFVKTKDFIPVYHIHGSIADPESIVITNEDYAQTLRVSDYRHARLPFLIKESTVLMVGYSLNDLNVLSAVDYSQNVYRNICRTIETPIIQLLYKDTSPQYDPYIKNGIIIQEIDDLSSYFAELIDYIKRYKSLVGKKSNEARKILEFLINSDDGSISEFIIDKESRRNIINAITDLDFEFWYIYPSYMAFLNKSLAVLWDRAHVQNAFSYYRNILELLLDVIENVDYTNVPASFLDYLIERFKEIAYYIGSGYGQSWEAKTCWDNRCHNLPQEFVDELIRRPANEYESRLIEQLLSSRKANKGI